jgi:hypothetical protein
LLVKRIGPYVAEGFIGDLKAPSSSQITAPQPVQEAETYVLRIAGALTNQAGAPGDTYITTKRQQLQTNERPRQYYWRKGESFMSLFVSTDKLLRLPNSPVKIETKNPHIR